MINYKFVKLITLSASKLFKNDVDSNVYLYCFLDSEYFFHSASISFNNSLEDFSLDFFS